MTAARDALTTWRARGIVVATDAPGVGGVWVQLHDAQRAENPFLRCPSVTPHLSSTCAHHVLVRQVREFVAETDVSRENQTRKIDRMAKELAALCLYVFLLYLGVSSHRIPRIADRLLAPRSRLIFLNASAIGK